MVDLDQFGFNYNVGQDYARITYRYFKERVNNFEGTAAIFPSETIVNQLTSVISFRNTVFDRRFQSSVQEMHNWFTDTEVKNDVSARVSDTLELDMKYIEAGDLIDSPYGEGGFVFLLDKETKRDRVSNEHFSTISHLDHN